MHHHTPTHAAVEARDCLIDVLGDLTTLVGQIVSTGTDLLPPQVEALDRLVQAAIEAERQIGGDA